MGSPGQGGGWTRRLVPDVLVGHHEGLAEGLGRVQPHPGVLLHGGRELPGDGHGARVQGAGEGREQGLVRAAGSHACRGGRHSPPGTGGHAPPGLCFGSRVSWDRRVIPPGRQQRLRLAVKVCQQSHTRPCRSGAPRTAGAPHPVLPLTRPRPAPTLRPGCLSRGYLAGPWGGPWSSRAPRQCRRRSGHSASSPRRAATGHADVRPTDGQPCPRTCPTADSRAPGTPTRAVHTRRRGPSTRSDPAAARAPRWGMRVLRPLPGLPGPEKPQSRRSDLPSVLVACGSRETAQPQRARPPSP